MNNGTLRGLIYYGGLKAGDVLVVNGRAERGTGSFWMNFDSNDTSYVFRTANPVQYTFNIKSDSPAYSFWLGRNTIPSAGYWGKVYVYDILLNGVKIL